MSDRASPRISGFLPIYALAYAGGVIGYLPLLTFLLPIKVEQLAAHARFDVLTACVIGGAIAASLANIAFGMLSDRSVVRGGGRRRWIAGGVIGTAGSFALIDAAGSALAIAVAVALFQIAINMLLAPLIAILADEVPDAQKGMAGALLSIGAPVASGVSAMVVSTTTVESARFALAAGAMALCVAPLLVTRLPLVLHDRGAAPPPALARTDLAIIWTARLAVQVAGTALSLYLLYYFQTIEPGASAERLGARVGHLLTLALGASVPVALVMGRLSDRWGRRKPPLVAAALIAAAGLVGMAVAGDWTTAAVALTLYHVGSAAFVALLSGFAILLLPSPQHHGRDLGLINLANTLPSLAGPALTWMLVTPESFAPLLLLLAALTASGGLALLAVRGRR